MYIVGITTDLGPAWNLLGRIMSFLRYLCLFEYSGVQHILRCAFVLFFVVLCTLSYVASFSGLSIFD